MKNNNYSPDTRGEVNCPVCGDKGIVPHFSAKGRVAWCPMYCSAQILARSQARRKLGLPDRVERP